MSYKYDSIGFSKKSVRVMLTRYVFMVRVFNWGFVLRF